ncbi:MAG: ABC transporter permease [Gemmatimonadota bacterium]|nr:ABC transporter permease [Gemmatimonadota bacterium]
MSPGWRRILRVPRPVDRQAREDVEAEIRFHLDSRTEELVAGGLDREAARARAEREFGDVRAAREILVPQARRRERRARLGAWTGELRRDLVRSVRGLRRTPAFTLVAVTTLALAIGATTGIFSVANAVLFRPLPYADPDRIVQVMEAEEPENPRNHISSATYIDWRNEAASFEAFGAYGFQLPLVLTEPGAPPQQVETVAMTPAAFRVLGARPALGRLFTPEEGRPGSPRSVVLSWSLWRTRFGGDESVLGRRIALDDQAYEVVGVMGPRFGFPDHDVQAWPSLRFAAASEGANRRAHQWSAIGRLAPGVPAERADAELDAISARLEAAHPESMTGWRAYVVPFRADLTRSVRPLVWILLAVVGVVLLVACANLANLMLARFTARRRELAVRSALGAGRGRLVRAALVESAVLSAVGGALGVALAIAFTRLFVALAPPDIPLLATTRADPAVLGFALAATIASTVLFGLLPALRSTRVDPAAVLAEGRRGEGGGRSETRLRSAILVSEVALSSWLLIGAGLLVRTMIELHSVDLGFEPEGLTAVTIRLPTSAYPTREEQRSFFDPLSERLRALPGVEAVAGTTEPPVVGYQMTFGYAVASQPRSGPDPMEDPVQLRAVTPGSFETVRQPVLAGRPFAEADGDGAPAVAIVNASLADRHWPGTSPVGDRMSTEGPEGPWYRIVGVVADTRHRGAMPAEPALYVPFDQRAWSWMSWQTLLLRTSEGMEVPRGAVDEAIWSLDASLVAERFAPVPDLYAESRARSRFAAQLMVAFAGVALLLGAVGLYGVLAYGVARRRIEIGVRMALGAGKGAIARLVLYRGLALAAVGLSLGVGTALLATRALESLLFGVPPRDPWTFAAVPCLLLAVAALAAWLPARRAADTEPARVLREG